MNVSLQSGSRTLDTPGSGHVTPENARADQPPASNSPDIPSDVVHVLVEAADAAGLVMSHLLARRILVALLPATYRHWFAHALGTPEEIRDREAAAERTPDDTIRLCEIARPGEHERQVRQRFAEQTAEALETTMREWSAHERPEANACDAGREHNCHLIAGERAFNEAIRQVREIAGRRTSHSARQERTPETRRRHSPTSPAAASSPSRPAPGRMRKEG